MSLPPISGTLNRGGPLTSTLADALDELKSGGGVFTPGAIFDQFTSKWPQFAGDQHDSHELLRHLLESVRYIVCLCFLLSVLKITFFLLNFCRSEDLRRYQEVILKSLGYNKKTEPSTVEGVMKQQIKFYGQQASDRILIPDQVFRGFLVSTLTCQDCFHTSSRHEYFLDMSLPVNVEKPQPPIRRKSSPEPSSSNQAVNAATPSNSLTKHQLKKEKEKEKKSKRAQKKKIRDPNGGEAQEDWEKNLPNDENPQSSSSSCEQSDADVEDNLIDDLPKNYNRQSLLLDTNGNSESNGTNKSTLIAEKADDTPENSNKDSNDDLLQSESKPPAATTNTLVELGISTAGSISLLTQDLNKVSLSNDVRAVGDESVVKFFGGNDDEGNEETDHRRKQQRRTRTISHSDWSTTIAPRYQCEDGECSIQSCLNNFTAVELMTGNNKVGCDNCTTRINGKDGKTVNTIATKQFLISSPPAVLILHLKRFQVGARCMFRKLSKTVNFPFLLDIAQFCGSKVKNLPNIKRKKKLIYSLYGIVEHSGGMHGGHYVAYVKVRPQLDSKDPRWSFLPKGSKAELDQTDEDRARLEEAIAAASASEEEKDSDDSATDSNQDEEKIENIGEGDVEPDSKVEEEKEEGAVGGSVNDEPVVSPPPGKWYYVSDSRVQETTEENVRNSQAYLLFYERIY